MKKLKKKTVILGQLPKRTFEIALFFPFLEHCSGSGWLEFQIGTCLPSNSHAGPEII